MSTTEAKAKGKKVWKGALWKSAAKGDVKGLKKAIEKADHPVNEFDDERKTALHYAAESGSVDAIELLLGAGAKIDAVMRYGDPTPLHLALLARKEDAAIFLARRGANPNLQTPQHQSATDLAVAIGKRFELKFKESLKPVSFLMPTTTTTTTASSNSNPTNSTTTATTSAETNSPRSTTENSVQPKEENGTKIILNPAAFATAAAEEAIKLTGGSILDLVRQQQQIQQQQQSKTSPRDGNQQKSSSSSSTTAATTTTPRDGSANAQTTPKRRLPKEKLDRANALKRRIARNEQVIKALQFWPEPNKSSSNVKTASEILRNAVSQQTNNSEEASTIQQQPQQANKQRNTNQMVNELQQKIQQQQQQQEEDNHVHDVETALLMIQHLRSWFEPNVPPVLLPEWHSTSSQKPSEIAQQPQQQANQSQNDADQHPKMAENANVPFVSLTRIMIRWCIRICRLTIDTKDFDAWTMKSPTIKASMEEFRKIHAELSVQVEAQAPSLGESYTQVRENVDTLRQRLENLYDAYNSVLLSNSETTHFILALMMLIGATYWTFNSLNEFSSKGLVAKTKQFVAALLSLGTQANSDIHTIISCLRLITVVNGIIFYIKNPSTCKQLSEHCTTILLTIRALVMTVMQGGQKSNEYNMIVGSHLGKIRDIISTTVQSRIGPTLSSKEESAMAEAGVRLMTEALGYYESQITQPALKDVLVSMQSIPQLLKEFVNNCARARDTTLSTWIPTMKSAIDLANEVTKFCDNSLLRPEIDPDLVFESCANSCEQFIIQMLIAIAALGVENKVCPRQQLPISTRSFAFALVTIMDLCYLNS